MQVVTTFLLFLGSLLVPLCSPYAKVIQDLKSSMTLQSHLNIVSAERHRRAITGSTYLELCGVSSNNIPLVQYGENIRPGEWPWLAALFKRTSTGLNFICGGSLVTTSHIVTAAHCVQAPKRPVDLARNIVVALGKHNIFGVGDVENSQSRKVSQIMVNPQYNIPREFDNDLAVLLLSSPVRFSDNVRPACLWSAQEPPSSITGERGSVVGWGKTENGDPVSEEPKLVKMPIVTQEQCISNQDFVHLISDNTFCAGNRNGSGPCTGDSGGGLYVPETFPGTTNRRRWVLRGIVSRSLAIDRECDLSNYVIFTDVSKFSRWLRQIIPAQYFTASAPTAAPLPASPSVPTTSVPLVKLGTRNYFFSSELFNKYLNWNNARDICASYGLHLAVVETAEENRLIHMHVRKISNRYSPWLGGTDEKNEGRWIWQPTQTPLSYFNWWTYQPDGGTTENCLYMYADDGKWGDRDCSNTKPYVCEQAS